MLPHEAIQDLIPYTKTLENTLKTLFYVPCIVPVIIILVATIFYYRSQRKLQQMVISIALLMVLIPFFAMLFYAAVENDFLSNYVVYKGNCKPLHLGVSTESNRKDLYIDFTCDNDPNHVFKVWDPDIIAYVANHPGVSPLQYRLSARHTLLPITSAGAIK